MVCQEACKRRWQSEPRSRPRWKALRRVDAGRDCRSARNPESRNPRDELLRRSPPASGGTGQMSGNSTILEGGADARTSTDYVAAKCSYMANPDARAALAQTECGACTDWTI